MNNKICEAFDKIHAEDSLKQKATDFLYEKIKQQDHDKKSVRLRLAAVYVSFALLFTIGGISFNFYFTSSAYVDIDVNPSIELVINRFGRVIDAAPYNDDGVAILKDVRIRHLSYNDAVDQLIQAMMTNDYLNQDSLLSITVQTNDEKKEISMVGSLQSTIDHSLQIHHAGAAIDVFSVNENIKNHSHENHMTPAKYLAISKLQQIDSTANFENCRNHTISEINQMIQEHSGGHHGNISEDDEEKHNCGHH